DRREPRDEPLRIRSHARLTSRDVPRVEDHVHQRTLAADAGPGRPRAPRRRRRHTGPGTGRSTTRARAYPARPPSRRPGPAGTSVAPAAPTATATIPLAAPRPIGQPEARRTPSRLAIRVTPSTSRTAHAAPTAPPIATRPGTTPTLVTKPKAA